MKTLTMDLNKVVKICALNLMNLVKEYPDAFWDC